MHGQPGPVAFNQFTNMRFNIGSNGAQACSCDGFSAIRTQEDQPLYSHHRAASLSSHSSRHRLSASMSSGGTLLVKNEKYSQTTSSSARHLVLRLVFIEIERPCSCAFGCHLARRSYPSEKMALISDQHDSCSQAGILTPTRLEPLHTPHDATHRIHIEW